MSGRTLEELDMRAIFVMVSYNYDPKQLALVVAGLEAEVERLSEAARWIPVGERTPELKYGGKVGNPDASDNVEVAYRYVDSVHYFRMVVQYWREYGWVYEWAAGKPHSFEEHGYVVEYWRALPPLPQPPK